MNILVLMLPGALLLAGMALAGFIWALKSGQFEDPAGDAARVLLDEDRPI
jgi:cbb3-type cytochrome oxidase maturation protein